MNGKFPSFDETLKSTLKKKKNSVNPKQDKDR